MNYIIKNRDLTKKASSNIAKAIELYTKYLQFLTKINKPEKKSNSGEFDLSLDMSTSPSSIYYYHDRFISFLNSLFLLVKSRGNSVINIEERFLIEDVLDSESIMIIFNAITYNVDYFDTYYAEILDLTRSDNVNNKQNQGLDSIVKKVRSFEDFVTLDYPFIDKTFSNIISLDFRSIITKSKDLILLQLQKIVDINSDRLDTYIDCIKNAKSYEHNQILDKSIKSTQSISTITYEKLTLKRKKDYFDTQLKDLVSNYKVLNGSISEIETKIEYLNSICTENPFGFNKDKISQIKQIADHLKENISVSVFCVFLITFSGFRLAFPFNNEL